MSGAMDEPQGGGIDAAPRGRTGRRKLGSAIPNGAGALKARPGYEVGYAKPPETTRFQKGTSGNPRGRPKGKKSHMPALSEERMKAIILEEAYRTITVRDGTRNVTVPIARAVLRSLAVNAVKGNHRSQRLFAELLFSVERANRALHDEWLITAMQYKVDWEIELDRRARLGITHLPDPSPHPDHVLIDLQDGTARVFGPSTNEEKAAWNQMLAHKAEVEEVTRQLQERLTSETKPRKRALLEGGIRVNQHVVKMIGKVEKGEAIAEGR